MDPIVNSGLRISPSRQSGWRRHWCQPREPEQSGEGTKWPIAAPLAVVSQRAPSWKVSGDEDDTPELQMSARSSGCGRCGRQRFVRNKSVNTFAEFPKTQPCRVQG